MKAEDLLYALKAPFAPETGKTVHPVAAAVTWTLVGVLVARAL